MNQQRWVLVAGAAGVIAALGLGIAALVLALDDETGVDGLESRLGVAPAAAERGGGRPRLLPPPSEGEGFERGGGAWLGVEVGETDEGEEGVVVETVVPGSPAAEAGLEAGDVIASVDGETVRDRGALVAAIEAREPGEAAELEIVRGDERESVEVELGRRGLPIDLEPPLGGRFGERPDFPGFDGGLEGLFPELAPDFGGPGFERGSLLARLLPELFGDFFLGGPDGLERLSVRAELQIGEGAEAMTVSALTGEVREVDADSISVQPDDAGDPVSFGIGEETAFVPSREAVAAGARVFVVGLNGEARAIVASGSDSGGASSRPSA